MKRGAWSAEDVFVGVDSGSEYAKAVALSTSGEVLAAVADVGGASCQGLVAALESKLKRSVQGGRVRHTIATGRGSSRVSGVSRTVSEVICHGRGVRYLLPSARMVLDLGARDIRLILLDTAGVLEDFRISDKATEGMRKLLALVDCAARAPRSSCEATAGELETRLELASGSLEEAEFQVVSWLATGRRHEDIVTSICRAIAEGIRPLLEIRPAQDQDTTLVLTGGFAENVGVREAIKEISIRRTAVAPRAQFTGAVGAAVIAREWGSNRAGKGRGVRPVSETTSEAAFGGGEELPSPVLREVQSDDGGKSENVALRRGANVPESEGPAA
ncbi:MAG: hypothetical protein HZB55_00585 [Deltaproteobacteria bacterium]|nr:hypothetical protein [Deltaproteobacteria bacterium]